MLAFLVLSVALVSPQAEARGFCASVDWDDLVDNSGDFLEGGGYALGLGGKGYVDADGEIAFDAYSSADGYLGSADVDASGTVTLSGDVTAFTPLAYGLDCTRPETLRYFVRATVDGTPFYVFLY